MLVRWERGLLPSQRTLLLCRPCPYGKGGQDAHDEEELYFHCEYFHSAWPLPSLLPGCACIIALPTPCPGPATDRFLGPILVSVCIAVKVPTRRTFLDPQSCGDPLQALHLFAKELDVQTVTLERSLGAGKLGFQGALSIPRAPLAPHPASAPRPSPISGSLPSPQEAPAPPKGLHPMGLHPPGSREGGAVTLPPYPLPVPKVPETSPLLPFPSCSLQTATGRRPKPSWGSGEGPSQTWGQDIPQFL